MKTNLFMWALATTMTIGQWLGADESTTHPTSYTAASMVEYLEWKRHAEYQRRRNEYNTEHQSLSQNHRLIREYKMRELLNNDPAVAHALVLYWAWREVEARSIIQARKTWNWVKMIWWIDLQINAGAWVWIQAEVWATRSYSKKDQSHLETQSEIIEQRQFGWEFWSTATQERHTSSWRWSNTLERNGWISWGLQANAQAWITGTLDIWKSIQWVYLAYDESNQTQYRINVQLDGWIQALLIGMKQAAKDETFLSDLAWISSENLLIFQADEQAEISTLNNNQLAAINMRKNILESLNKEEREVLQDPSKKWTEEYREAFEKFQETAENILHELRSSSAQENQTAEEFVQGQIERTREFLAQYGSPNVQFTQTQRKYDTRIQEIEADLQRNDISEETRKQRLQQLEEVRGWKLLHEISYYENNARAAVDSVALAVWFFDKEAWAEIGKKWNDLINVAMWAARIYAWDFTAIPQLLWWLWGLFGGSSWPSADEIMIGMLEDILKNQKVIIEALQHIALEIGELRQEVAELAEALRNFERGNKESFRAVQSSLDRIERAVYGTMDLVQRVETNRVYQEISSSKEAVTFLFTDNLERRSAQAMIDHISNPSEHYNQALADTLRSARQNLMRIAQSEAISNPWLDYNLDFDIDSWQSFSHHYLNIPHDRQVAGLDTISYRFNAPLNGAVGNPFIIQEAWWAYIDMMRHLPSFWTADQKIDELCSLVWDYERHDKQVRDLFRTIIQTYAKDLSDLSEVYNEWRVEIFKRAFVWWYIEYYTKTVQTMQSADQADEHVLKVFGKDNELLKIAMQAVDRDKVRQEFQNLSYDWKRHARITNGRYSHGMEKILLGLNIIYEDIKNNIPDTFIDGWYIDSLPDSVILEIALAGSFLTKQSQWGKMNRKDILIPVDGAPDGYVDAKVDDPDTWKLYQQMLADLAKAFPENPQIQAEYNAVSGIRRWAVFHIDIEHRTIMGMKEDRSSMHPQKFPYSVKRTDGNGNILFEHNYDLSEVVTHTRKMYTAEFDVLNNDIVSRESTMQETWDFILSRFFAQDSSTSLYESLLAFEIISDLIWLRWDSEFEVSIRNIKEKNIGFQWNGVLYSPVQDLYNLVKSPSTLEQNSDQLKWIIDTFEEILILLDSLDTNNMETEWSSILLTRLHAKLQVLKQTRPDLVWSYCWENN